MGHYLGCGWDADQIAAHLQQHPDGIGSRYLAEDRLHKEIARSAGKFGSAVLPLFDANGWTTGWVAKAPQPQKDPSEWYESEPKEPLPEHEQDEPDKPQLEPELRQDDPELDPERDPDLVDDDDLDEEVPPLRPNLPPLHAHGDHDPRPIKSWLIKHLIPAVGHGLAQRAVGRPARRSWYSIWRPHWAPVSRSWATP